MYLHEDKCTTYLEYHFVFNKGNTKLIFPKKTFYSYFGFLMMILLWCLKMYHM